MPSLRVINDLSKAGAGPFVLLVGAGISLWHPSSLPTWGEFNTALLDEAKISAQRAIPKRSPLHKELEALKVDNIGSKAFSNALVENLAGESYFNIVDALAVSAPNGAHRAIARLVSRGIIAAIVTTNFDTLLEQALLDEGINADIYSRPRDYSRKAGHGVPVFKIHGTAMEAAGLIDTVGQKLRGLAPLVRDRLRKWFVKYPVVSLGYSGGDLEFGADYLSLQVIPAGADRLWWIVRPEDSDHPEPATRALVDKRGAFVAMSQEAALIALGAGPVTLEWNTASRRERLIALRSQAGLLFKKYGHLNTFAFCMRLVSAAGRMNQAAAMWKFIANSIERRKRQTVAAVGPAMRALSAEAHRMFGVLEQERWACRQLTDIRKRRTNSRTAYGKEEDYIRDVRYEALAYLMIGDSRVRRGQHDAAGLAMQRSMEGCEHSGDIALLSGIYRLYGWRDSERFTHTLKSVRPLRETSDAIISDLIQRENSALNYLMAAEATALVGGNVDAIESARLRAELFMFLGEYDAASLCLERLVNRVGLGIHRETEVRIETTLGEIDVRQGKIDKAMERWNKCLTGLASGAPMLEAHVQSAIIGRVGFSPKWRAIVLTHCDDLINKMLNGVLPDGGHSDLLYTCNYFKQAREGLISLGSERLEPGFIQNVDNAATRDEFLRWPAYYVKQELIVYEFREDNARVLDCLDRLVSWQYDTASGSRSLDAATAHVRRAQRDGNAEQCFIADVNLAAIRRWLGDAESEAWFVKALRSARAKDPKIRRGLERRLPHDLWTTNSETPKLYPRNIELDLEDALALKWVSPPTGIKREKSAIALVAANNLVMGRLLALQAIASYQEEGDPSGFARAFKILKLAGSRDQRSGEDAFILCH